MKTTKLFFSILIACAVIISCNKKQDNDAKPVTPPTPAQWESNVTVSDMSKYLITKAPTLNSYSISGALGGTVVNDSISVNIPSNAFALQNGTAYSGDVIIKMQTIRNVAHMIYSGVTTTTKNEMLLSDGMFMLEAYDNTSNPLKLRTGTTLTADFSFGNFSPSSKVFKGTLSTTGEKNKVEWNEWDSTSVKRGNKGALIFGLDSLFRWCNLDRYMNETPLTNITVNTPTGYTNINTDCYLKYTGENSCSYIPSNPTLKAFSTTGSYYKVVQGRAAKVICLAKKDNKFYYQIITIAAISTNQVLTITNMIEATEIDLNAIVTAF